MLQLCAIHLEIAEPGINVPPMCRLHCIGLDAVNSQNHKCELTGECWQLVRCRAHVLHVKFTSQNPTFCERIRRFCSTNAIITNRLNSDDTTDLTSSSTELSFDKVSLSDNFPDCIAGAYKSIKRYLVGAFSQLSPLN